MKQYHAGDKVRFLHEDLHECQPRWYPEVGTVGIVENADEELIDGSIYVQWPFGTTSMDDKWCVTLEMIEKVDA